MAAAGPGREISDRQHDAASHFGIHGTRATRRTTPFVCSGRRQTRPGSNEVADDADSVENVSSKAEWAI
jgi:hypothetical protein